jgi:hypothetical protein
MEEYLKNNGWTKVSGCNCGGIPSRKYYNPKFPLYKIQVLYTRGTFIILKNNMRYVPDCKGEEIEKTLKNHGLTE